MHHIYHTEWIILKNRNFGEAGKYYYIFTRDLGMIVASAQGVRKMSSKLRYILQDFAHVKIDFVRGKDFWKITSASKTNALENATRTPETIRIFSNITRLITRLLSGEESNEKLFTDLVSGFSVLEKSSTNEEFRNIEAILVLRILDHLGYIGENETLTDLIKSPLAEDVIFEASKKRKNILREINKALKETQL